MFLKLNVLFTNRQIIDLVGEAWPQTELFFECVNKSSITVFFSVCVRVDTLLLKPQIIIG